MMWTRPASRNSSIARIRRQPRLREHGIEIEKLKAIRVSITKPHKAVQLNPKALTNAWKEIYSNDDDDDDDDDGAGWCESVGLRAYILGLALLHGSQQESKSSPWQDLTGVACKAPV